MKKKRAYKLLNFFAFNLLFFALYLNFVHKDASAAIPAVQQTTSSAEVKNIPASSVTQPEIKQKAGLQEGHKKTVAAEKEGEALRLSVN